MVEKRSTQALFGRDEKIGFNHPAIKEGIKLNKMKETSKNNENAQLGIGTVSHSRIVGKTHAMVMSIKATIEQGGKAGVAGCKDPQLNLKHKI